MADTPPIISQVDYSTWNTWQPIYEPGTNREFRVVPGFGGMYVFDPYESNATGKISIYQNPSKVYEATEQQKKDAEKASGIEAQVAPIAGNIVGAYGVNAISNVIAGGGAAGGTGAGVAGTGAAGGTAAGSGVASGGIGSGFATVALPLAAAVGGYFAGNELEDRIGGNKGRFAADLISPYRRPIEVALGKDDSTYGRISAGLMTGGFSEIGRAFFGHESTAERRAKRSNALAEKDNTYAQYLSDSANNQDLVGSLIEKGKAATPEGYKGFWDDPSTEQNDYIWVNKQAPTEGFKHNAEYFNTLGAGDVMNNPWFFENFEGWGSKSMDERAKIADAALKSGTAFGNAGNIDFKADPNSLLAEQTNDSLLSKSVIPTKIDAGASWTGEKRPLPGGAIGTKLENQPIYNPEGAYNNMSYEELAKKLAEMMDGKTEMGVSKQPSYFLK